MVVLLPESVLHSRSFISARAIIIFVVSSSGIASYPASPCFSMLHAVEKHGEAGYEASSGMTCLQALFAQAQRDGKRL